MSIPFLVEQRDFRGGSVHLLPTANVVLVMHGDPAASGVEFVFPHRGIRVLHDVAECLSLSPNFVKCLIGEPRRHRELVLPAADHAMLTPFASITGSAQATDLLHDLRDSLAVTPDERDFLDLWMSVGAGEQLPTSDRWLQRLCLRYAGQAPTAINTLTRLARTLDTDNASGRYNGLGAFADASHFARICRAHTGRPPTAWRNMSQTFY